MISVDQIAEYWRSSELRAIADYNEDGIFDKDVVQSAINDAYNEIAILSGYHPEETIDLFAKRLTICILLSRLNVNPEAVVLPMNDCKKIHDLVSEVLKKKTENQADVDLRKKSAGLHVSEGEKPLSDILGGY